MFRKITAHVTTCTKLTNAMVTHEIKLFQNYFRLRRCPSEILIFQRVETSRNYCKIISEANCSSQIFSNIFNVAEI